MFFKKVSAANKAEFDQKIKALLPDAESYDADIRDIKLRWLSSFAPDITLRDAKDYCLPRRRFKNYLWHAFSFRLTDCLAGEEAAAEYSGFAGECFILSEDSEEIYTVVDGSVLIAELLKKLENVTVFKKDFTETFTITGVPEVGPFYKKAVE